MWSLNHEPVGICICYACMSNGEYIRQKMRKHSDEEILSSYSLKQTCNAEHGLYFKDFSGECRMILNDHIDMRYFRDWCKEERPKLFKILFCQRYAPFR